MSLQAAKQQPETSAATTAAARCALRRQLRVSRRLASDGHGLASAREEMTRFLQRQLGSSDAAAALLRRIGDYQSQLGGADEQRGFGFALDLVIHHAMDEAYDEFDSTVRADLMTGGGQ